MFREDLLIIGAIVIMILIMIGLIVMIFLATSMEKTECQNDCEELGWRFWRYKDEACYCLKDGEPKHIWGDNADMIPVFMPMPVN